MGLDDLRLSFELNLH